MKSFKSARSVQDMKDLENRFINKIVNIQKKTKSKKRGWVYLMCPHCYKLLPVYINYKESVNISDKNVDFVLEEHYNILCCKGDEYVDAIELDYNIGEVISILNKKGYMTKFCCEGHGKNDGDDSYIYFKDDSILKYIDYLPITWYIELDDIKNKEVIQLNNNRTPIIIRSDFYDHDEAMLDILEFANNLPNY